MTAQYPARSARAERAFVRAAQLIDAGKPPVLQTTAFPLSRHRHHCSRGLHGDSMARITLQMIEGLERGRTFSDLPTPVTLGREDENTIRLNDERVSRFHAKIQEDGGRIILTDLDSTNGTRVNGHPVQMRVLQIGDHLSIGRCLLVYGSREEIAREIRDRAGRPRERFDQPEQTIASPEDSTGAPLSSHSQPPGHDVLFPHGSPDPPADLRAFQRAELSDFLAYAHEQIRGTIQSAVSVPLHADGDDELMHISWEAWQRLMRLEMDLATYLRRLADPEQ